MQGRFNLTDMGCGRATVCLWLHFMVRQSTVGWSVCLAWHGVRSFVNVFVRRDRYSTSLRTRRRPRWANGSLRARSIRSPSRTSLYDAAERNDLVAEDGQRRLLGDDPSGVALFSRRPAASTAAALLHRQLVNLAAVEGLDGLDPDPRSVRSTWTSTR